jgi:hypothetical protein
MERCLGWWPFDADHWLTVIRREALEAMPKGALNGQGSPEFTRIRGLFDRALAVEPYNSQLRLELASFDLSFGADPFRTKKEIMDAVRIDRLRPAVPLKFAEALADRDPDFAMELLGRAPFAWRANRDASLLWGLTPPTATGWLALGDFAVDHELIPMATRAYENAAGAAPWRELFRRYMKAGLYEQALKTVGKRTGSADANQARGRAYRGLRNWAAANAAFSLVWLRSPLGPTLTQPLRLADLAMSAERMYGAAPNSLREAERIGETLRIEANSPKKAEALSRLHNLFPESLRLHWLAFDSAATVVSKDETANAAWLERSSELAETLAERVVAKDGNPAANGLDEGDEPVPRPSP